MKRYKITKLSHTIGTLERILREEKTALPRLLRQLTVMLADAHQSGSIEDPETDVLRAAVATAQQNVSELPLVIEELTSRLEDLRAAEVCTEQEDSRARNDRLFFELLESIIALGKAAPADLAELRCYAANSSNPARKYDVDRLTECLEDHDRKTATARQWGQPLPVFQFLLEEQER